VFPSLPARPQRIAWIDADEEKSFGLRRLQIFADHIGCRSIFAHQPYFKRHAGIRGTGTKALDD